MIIFKLSMYLLQKFCFIVVNLHMKPDIPNQSRPNQTITRCIAPKLIKS